MRNTYDSTALSRTEEIFFITRPNISVIIIIIIILMSLSLSLFSLFCHVWSSKVIFELKLFRYFRLKEIKRITDMNTSEYIPVPRLISTGKINFLKEKEREKGRRGRERICQYKSLI